MNTAIDTLPWSALGSADADIPWDELSALAAGLVASHEPVADRLCDVHLDEIEFFDDQRPYEGIYALAVFALAVDRLEGPARRYVAEALVTILEAASAAWADMTCDTVMKLSERFGPELANVAMDRIEDDPDCEAIIYLWGLANDAMLADDEAVRDRLRRLSRTHIQRWLAHRTDVTPIDLAVWGAAHGGDPKSRELAVLVRDQLKSGDRADTGNDFNEVRYAVKEWGREPNRYPDFESPRDWLPRERRYIDDWLQRRDEKPEVVTRSGALNAWADRDRSPVPETVRLDEARVGRNDPCPCGSGKKHKKCCGR